MNKTMIIEQMTKETKMSKSACRVAMDALLKVIGSSLKKGKTVVLTGFGTFCVVKRKARTGINPATGKKMQISAKRVPKFRAGKRLKETVS